MNIKKLLNKELSKCTYEELLCISEYYKTLQLQQNDTITCKTVRNCRECHKQISCDKDFCDEKCRYSYFR